jgi:hypothetical protein
MTQSLIFYYVSPTILVAIKYGINLSIGAAMVGHLVLKPALGDAQIISTVNDRVGSVPQLLRRVLYVLLGAQTSRAPLCWRRCSSCILCGFVGRTQ